MSVLDGFCLVQSLSFNAETPSACGWMTSMTTVSSDGFPQLVFSTFDDDPTSVSPLMGVIDDIAAGCMSNGSPGDFTGSSVTLFCVVR